MDNSKNSGKLFLAGIVGATLGTAVAILYAPGSGRDTRARLRMETELAVAKLENAIDELKGSIEHSVSETGDEIGYLIGSATARTSFTTNELIHILERKLKKLKSSKGGRNKKVAVKKKK
ncbi:MAG: YtxH domain-containing protein [Pricia sp.]